MSGALSEVPGPGAVPGQVFRSELNPVDFLQRAAYIYPDKAAVVDGGRRYSYRDLAERSWRLANALRSAGLGKGDRVATLLFNSSAMLEAHFGVPAAGGILVAVNHRLAAAEIGYILRHSGARYLLLDTALEALAGQAGLAGVIGLPITHQESLNSGFAKPLHVHEKLEQRFCCLQIAFQCLVHGFLHGKLDSRCRSYSAAFRILSSPVQSTIDEFGRGESLALWSALWVGSVTNFET